MPEILTTGIDGACARESGHRDAYCLSLGRFSVIYNAFAEGLLPDIAEVCGSYLGKDYGDASLLDMIRHVEPFVHEVDYFLLCNSVMDLETLHKKYDNSYDYHIDGVTNVYLSRCVTQDDDLQRVSLALAIEEINDGFSMMSSIMEHITDAVNVTAEAVDDPDAFYLKFELIVQKL